MKSSRKSAGILLYRKKKEVITYFLVHPGGPFWKNKDAGSWSIPKGEFDQEDPEDAARREFREETGHLVRASLLPLGTARQKSGKTVYAFAAEEDFDETRLVSNEFPLEWPPRSGKRIMVPEVDRGAWFGFGEACVRINPGQLVFLQRLRNMLTREVAGE